MPETQSPESAVPSGKGDVGATPPPGQVLTGKQEHCKLDDMMIVFRFHRFLTCR